MKYLFSTYIFIIAGLGYCNAQRLEVNIKYCSVKTYRTAYLSEFKLYKDTILIRIVKPEYDKATVISIKVLGKYRIEYKTLFDITENVIVDISSNKKHNIDLCLDHFNYKSDPYIPMINRLQNDENYTIEMHSQGCFHNLSDTIYVAKRAEGFFLVYKGIERKLIVTDIEAIQHFEIELNHMEASGCTTLVTYIIKYNNEIVFICDGSCIWNGDMQLKVALGLGKRVESN